jgi:DNA-binding NtrC family response regulator
VSGLDVLLVAGDGPLCTMMEALLRGHRTVVCRHLPEARDALAARRYDLIIVTNFGIPPHLAVEIIPAERRYPVLFFTGHMDERLEHECRRRGIPWVEVPLGIDALRRELRIALDDPTL